MLRETLGRPLLLLLGALHLSAASPAQAEYSLWYVPDVPGRINLVSRSEITMTVMPIGQGPLDTLTIEATRLESATVFANAAANDRFTLVLQYDSVRARMRPRGGLWEQLEVQDDEVATVRAIVDGRMRILQAEFVNTPHLHAPNSHMVRGLSGGILLALPSGPVAPNEPWTSEVAYPLSYVRSIGEQEGVPDNGELRSRATSQIDSLATRGSDTLYYLAVRGTFLPAQFQSRLNGGSARTTVIGSFASVMVWSSARSAFVSSASRVALRMDVREPQSEARSQVRFDVITRSQVRL